MPTVDRALASKAFVADNATTDFRVGRYGEMIVSPLFMNAMAAADEGSYFCAVNATDNTAITGSVATSYSGTASAFFAFRNTDSNADGVASSGKRIYMDYIKYQFKVAPANATDWRMVWDVDNVLTRFTSGGTTITPQNVNMGVSTATICTLSAGALTTVAISGSGRTLSRILARAVIPVVLETHVIQFGMAAAIMGGGVVNGTNPQIYTYNAPPSVLPQNAVGCLSQFGTSYAITAHTLQFECGWIER